MGGEGRWTSGDIDMRWDGCGNGEREESEQGKGRAWKKDIVVNKGESMFVCCCFTS